MKKLKITETQLKTIMEQGLNDEFHVDKEGQLQQGNVEFSDLYQLAEEIVSKMTIPSEVSEDEYEMRRLADAIHEVMNHQVDSGEIFQKKTVNPLSVTDAQVNEMENKIKRDFQRYL